MKKRPSGRSKRRVADLDALGQDPDDPVRLADEGDHCAKRRLVAPWSHVVAGADHPPWPRHFVDTLRASLLQLK